jgi:carboxylesterase type B
VLGHVDMEGYDDTDKIVSDMTMKYWAQFAKTGNPSIDGLPEWPKYVPGANKYLMIDEKISVGVYAEDHPLRE